MAIHPENQQGPQAAGGGKSGSHWTGWWPLLVGLILLALLALRWSAPGTLLLARDPIPAPSTLAARNWYKAVHLGDRQAAASAASEIVPWKTPPPLEAYDSLFEANRISSSFLVSSFTEWDAIYWEDLYFFRKLADQIPLPSADDTADPALADAELQTVSDFVRAHIVGEEPNAQNAWPRDIWERGYGVCDRLCWVAAKLLYQRGYEVAIVYLHDNPDYQRSPHTILAVRRGERTWTMDILMGRILPDCSADALADQAPLRELLWPDRPDWQRSMSHALLLIPSNPLEYCPRTILLAKRLRALGITDLPRFGRDPLERQLAYQALRVETGSGPPRLAIAPWTQPLRVFFQDLNRMDQHVRQTSPVEPTLTTPAPGSSSAPTVILRLPGASLPATGAASGD